MAKVKITGHASGSGVFTITAPNSNTDRTITLPDASVTLGTDATKLPLAGGALTGAVTTNSAFDGRDVAADGVLATNALPKAGGTLTGNLTVGTTSVADPILLIQSSGSGDPQLNLSSAAANRSGKIRFLDNGSAVGGFINYLHNGDKMEFGSGSSTTVGFRVADGYSNAAQGLTFGSDTAAANKLDDYEEGTWTMVMTGSSSGSGNVGTGHYTKTGRMVHCFFIIDNQSLPTFSGTMRISLPFTGSNGNSNRNEGSGDVYFYPLSKWTTGSTFNGIVFQIFGNNPTYGYFQIKKTNTDRQAPVNDSQGSNSGADNVYARFSITYTAT